MAVAQRRDAVRPHGHHARMAAATKKYLQRSPQKILCIWSYSDMLFIQSTVISLFLVADIDLLEVGTCNYEESSCKPTVMLSLPSLPWRKCPFTSTFQSSFAQDAIQTDVEDGGVLWAWKPLISKPGPLDFAIWPNIHICDLRNPSLWSPSLTTQWFQLRPRRMVLFMVFQVFSWAPQWGERFKNKQNPPRAPRAPQAPGVTPTTIPQAQHYCFGTYFQNVQQWVLSHGLLRYTPYTCKPVITFVKWYAMDCFGTYFGTHAQNRDNVRVQSATQWTASAHALVHVRKPVITFVFQVLYAMDCFRIHILVHNAETCD